MPTKPARHGKKWTSADIKELKRMVRQNLDTDEIARRLQRTVEAIYSKASDESVSLRPKDT